MYELNYFYSHLNNSFLYVNKIFSVICVSRVLLKFSLICDMYGLLLSGCRLCFHFNTVYFCLSVSVCKYNRDFVK